MRVAYPDIEPYQRHLFDMPAEVGEAVHQIYVEECGNPIGIPIVFLHGGPGSGCRPSHRCFFDPERYRIILLDQRGCGRSKPFGCLENNSTDYLIDDLENIRELLAVEKWIVFGGSWGATLALAYAQQYPQRVTALALRGIFLGRKHDIDWVYHHDGAAKIFPESWAVLMATLTQHERKMPIQSLYSLLQGNDARRLTEVSEALEQWERQLVKLSPVKPPVFHHRHRHQQEIQINVQNNASLSRIGEGSNPLDRSDKVHVANSDEASSDETNNKKQGVENAAKLIQLHYSVNECFLSERPILSNVEAIRAIPTFIIHGRYDLVCPVEQAWQLYQANPDIELSIMPFSGHVAEEPEILDAILNLTDQLARRFSDSTRLSG